MADAALSFLLDNVTKLLVEQIDLISGAEKELKELQNELELMKAFLMESANKREKGEVFSQFGRQIRQAVYHAENILDAVLMRKAKGSGFLGIDNMDLAKKVKDLREPLKTLFDRAMVALAALPMLDQSSATTIGTSNHLLKKSQSLREHNVVGLADEEATLINNLQQQTEEVDVISIVGMPASGKTTLAWKICSTPEIQTAFSPLIWVHASEKFNARDVFLTILKKLTEQDMSTKDNRELTEEVRSHLDKAGRYLLFMDDVCSVGDWKLIEAVLPKTNKLGKVVITSRQTRVAKQANRNREPHNLRLLTSEESWKLLQLEVFGSNCTPPELEKHGRKIATQCWGLPLNVVVIGGVLVEKCVNRGDLWAKVSDSVSTYLWDDERKRTVNTISMSYNKLPDAMKNCFLYLGMFPKDTEISAWKLTRMWIAEGLIQQNKGRSFEEVAEDRLNDLVAMNLVMVVETKANGDVRTCRVHDTVREFCQIEAAFENRNLFQEVKKTRQGVFDPCIADMVKCRRISIHSDVIEFLQRKPKGHDVRSFVCFASEINILPQEYTPLVLEAFDLLRVIDVDPIKFTEFPSKQITKLMHLRYIALSTAELKSLPKDISKLWNLQTLTIDTASREFVVKVDISKMMHLRHIKTKAAMYLKVKEMKGGGGEHLQTLSRLSAKCCTRELFDKASNLTSLGIRGNLTSFVNANLLGRMERLENLKLVHDVFPEAAGTVALHRLPDRHSFPPNLRILTLSSTYLAWEHMATLGRLPSLEVLKLKEMAFKGRLWDARGGGFLQLESLHITNTDLERWTASGDPFPRLKYLILNNCARLGEFPSKLQAIATTKRGGSKFTMSSGSGNTSSTPNSSKVS